MAVESLSAITLATRDMEASLAFYAVLGFEKVWDGGRGFVVLRSGSAWLNLYVSPDADVGGWGRFILYVDDVDGTWRSLVDAGHEPEMAPSDAPWGERYFHVLDPTGHEVSIARRLEQP